MGIAELLQTKRKEILRLAGQHGGRTGSELQGVLPKSIFPLRDDDFA